MHTLTYAMGVIINYMGNYALKQVKFGAPLLSSMSIFTVSGWTEAHEKRSPIWGVWNAQQPQVYDLTGTRGSFWPAIFSQFMWFVSTYMALFTMFRLHHKVSLRLNCVYFNGQNKLLFCFYAAGMSWSALEACMGEFWKHNKLLHPSLIRFFCSGWCMYCWCLADGLLQGLLAISYNKPGALPWNVVNSTIQCFRNGCLTL